MVPYIHTVEGLTVALRGVSYNMSKEHKLFPALLDAINNRASEIEIEDILLAMGRKMEAKVKLTPYMEYSGGVVLYRGEVLGGYAVNKLIELIDSGQDVLPLARFLEKLQGNPSKQTIEHLYSFLEFGRMPITKDGNFLAYKAVRGNFFDIHSGTMDNSIGQVLRMPRKAVDDNRDVTCSTGLHVCSFTYLPNFTHADGHVVICEVSPADVVAIPSDYNNTKMRVSEYAVVGELEGYYKDHKDVLTNQGVWDPDFIVYARIKDTDEWTEVDDAEVLSQAMDVISFEIEADKEYVAEERWTEYKIVDSHGVTVWRKHV